MATAPLIGRERELARCARLVQRRMPALVLVSSDAGVGKSRFLQGLAEQTAPAGWTVVPGSGAPDLTVGRASMPAEFALAVRHVLGIPEPADPMQHCAALQGAAPGLARQLAARAPVMVLIDGYRPSPTFGAWFERQLLPEVRASREPVVIVVAEVPDQLVGCEERAAPELLLRLGPLRADAVRAHLAQACSAADPPLTDDELGRYSRAVSRDPELLQALVSVLCLGAAESAPHARGVTHA